MAKNKIVYGNETLIDLTGDTVVEDALVVGYTAHGADGELVAGGNPYKKAETDTTVQTQSDLIKQVKAALEGKASPGGGVQLPALTNPGTADDLALGRELIDADGNVVTGNVNIRDSGTWVWPDGVAAAYPDHETWGDYVIAQHTIASGTVMYRAPATVAIPVPLADFGDAQPSDVVAGKIFTSAAGLRSVGTGGGMVIKTGTTTSSTIDTGLKDIEQFIIYKESQTATGLIHLHYSKSGGTSRMYSSAWSTQSFGTKTITNDTSGVTVSGGTVTISATQAAQGALTSGVTYKWVAIGTA